MAVTTRPLAKDQPKDIRGLYDTLKTIAEQHVGISCFRCGESADYTGENLDYPLLYLELPFSFSVEGGSGAAFQEKYDVTLALADRMQSNIDELDIINALSRTKQLLVHVHSALDALVKCSPLRGLTYQNVGTDNMVVTRGQFTVTMYRADKPQDAAKASQL